MHGYNNLQRFGCKQVRSVSVEPCVADLLPTSTSLFIMSRLSTFLFARVVSRSPTFDWT